MQNSVIASTAKYKCSDCEIAFPYLQQLYRHKTVCKQQSKSSMCLRCGRALEKHHYTCKECNRCFVRRGFFECHQMQHKKKVKKVIQYNCHICHQKLSSRAKVKAHIRLHNDVNRFECDVCLKLFSKPSNMNKHKKTFHLEEAPEGSVDAPKRSVDALKISVDASNISVDASKISGDAALSDNDVKSDGIGDNELSSGDKLFCCQKCQLKFSDLSSFLKHRRIHTGVKPYTCSICNTGFCNASSLKQHVTSLHVGEDSQKLTKSCSIKVDVSTEDNSSDTGYKCVECDKIFFQFSVYNRHKMMHKRAEQYQAQKTIMTNVKKEPEVNNTTEITNVSESETPEQVDFSHDLPSASPVKFSCLKCGIDFNSKLGLHAHLRSHELSKSFTCSCGKNYSYKTSMMNHEDQHRAMKRMKQKEQHRAMKRKGKNASMSQKSAGNVSAATTSSSSLSARTKKAYATRRKSYMNFCDGMGIDPVPISSENLAKYIADLSARLLEKSVKQYLSAVCMLHQERGALYPGNDDIMGRSNLSLNEMS